MSDPGCYYDPRSRAEVFPGDGEDVGLVEVRLPSMATITPEQARELAAGLIEAAKVAEELEQVSLRR
jgi:hypothetical protein